MASFWSSLFRKAESSPITTEELIRRMAAAQFGEVGGISVTPEAAMRLTTVYTCIGIVGETMGMLPFHLYRRGANDSRERATDHPLYRLLTIAPNDGMDRFGFFEQMGLHLATGGNYYALPVRGVGGRLLELLPIPDPRNVKPEKRAGGAIVYTYTPDGWGARREFAAADVLHIRYRSFDGVCGISPIRYNAATIGGGLAAARHNSAIWRNMGAPAGVLEHPGKLSKEAKAALRDSWSENYGGGNAGKTPVLEEGLKFQKITLSPADLQYIEGAQLNREECCAIWRVPPHKAGDLSRAHFTNIEHQGQEFISDFAMVWGSRITAAIDRQLLTPAEQGTYYTEPCYEELLRADSTARGALYRVLFETGAITSNEIAKRENLPPAGALGETRYVAGNLMKLGNESIKQPGNPASAP